ncbi:MAG: hypothetical protein AAF558_09595 [Verrucomicrobiota bacterium]
MNHLESNRKLAEEAIAMMEKGRPTPVRQRHLFIDGLCEDWHDTFVHFGEPPILRRPQNQETNPAQ